MPKFVPVSNTLHANTKVKQDLCYVHAKKEHLIPLVIHEFARASHVYPIFFVKNREKDQFRSVAVLGLQANQNVFYNDNGWLGDYIPESLHGYPFVLATDPKIKDQQILYFDEESERVNQTEGKNLFNEKGETTEFTTKMGSFLSDNILKHQQTQVFIEALVADGLIVQQNLEITIKKDEKFNVSGLYMIDEKALNELSDEKFLNLKKKGYLPPIYAVLLSMSRVSSIIKKLNETS
jgi:hypothetical protein